MLRLRRDDDGNLMFADGPMGRGVRVEDDSGHATYVPVTALPEDLQAQDRAEVAQALPLSSQAGPPSAQQVAGQVAGGATPPLVAETPAQAPVAQAPKKGCHQPETDPVILDARRRMAQAAAAAQEAKAEEARVKLEQARRRQYQDGGGRGPAVRGPGVRYIPEGEDSGELEALRQEREAEEERRAIALARAEAAQAEMVTGHLQRKVEAKVRGTSGPQLFWVGFFGFIIGCILAAPVRAAFAAAGNPGAGEIAGMAVELGATWFAVWSRLRRVALERKAEEQRLERDTLRESVRARMEQYHASR